MTRTCPACQSAATSEFLRRDRVPVHQNLVCESEAAAVAVRRGSLAMAICERCDFVFNAEFDPSLLEYGEEYENTQTCSPAFSAYVDNLIDDIVEGCDLQNRDIVEIGCGKGTFITRLVERAPSSRGFGFDPSYVGPSTTADGRITFHREFYGPDTDIARPDVIVCRHVVEHVAAPLTLLQSLRKTLGRGHGTRVFFETPCVEWILRNRVVWDFFYEHCSLFTERSLAALFRRAGFDVTSVRHVFGGQYLWLEATTGDSVVDEACGDPEMMRLALEFGAAERQIVDDWRVSVERLRERGHVALWGAGAKGATLANLVDPTHAAIDSIVDLNPKKQGNYVPGTGHPIIDYHELPKRGVTSAILMNTNYRDENASLLAAAGIQVDLVEHTS